MQLKPTHTSIEIYPSKTPSQPPPQPLVLPNPIPDPTMSSTTTTSHTTTPIPPQPPNISHLSTLKTQGYVHIPSLLPAHLLLALQATSKYLTSKARDGSWPHIRSVPKQYPPWPTVSPSSPSNIWGVQHLLHPDMSVRDVYAEAYFHDAVLDVVKDLLDLPVSPASDDQLVMGLFNLLVSPSSKQSFQLAWHRDDIRATATPDEEASLLSEKAPSGRQLHAQYNIALFADSSLIVVPGSHRRIRTQAERDAGAYDEIPGQMVVALRPGDAVFYDSNILHRGVYEGIEVGREHGRMTLHGSVGLAGAGNQRARQVLQHGVGEWIGAAGFEMLEGPRRERAEGMRKRLVEMGRGEGLGFSLEG